MEAVALTLIAQPVEKGLSLERRTHCRFEVQNGAMCSSQLTVVGQITDVSLGGLTFHYVASRERSAETSVLSITLTNGTFQLDRIPFKVAWDIEMPQSFSCGPISIRLCGVEFGDLTDTQKLGLRHFIQNHTTADPEASRVTSHSIVNEHGQGFGPAVKEYFPLWVRETHDAVYDANKATI